MRITAIPPVSRGLARAGAALLCGGLLAGCGVVPEDLLPDGEESSASPSASPSGQPSATPDRPRFAMPESCSDVGAEEVAGAAVPQGATVVEDTDTITDMTDAEWLACRWSADETGDDAGGAESLTLVFMVNADPRANAEVVDVSGEREKMGWEVDVDTDIENYRPSEAADLGGELEFVSTVEGSSKSLHLSLPEEFHVYVSASSSDATQEELERLVLTAAERAQR